MDIFAKSDKEIEYRTPNVMDAITPTSYDQKLEYNVSKILDALIASHDRRIRPNYGGPPTEVNVTAHVITISGISEVSMDYTVDLYLRQFWRDTRLMFDNFDKSEERTSLTIGIDMVKSIWTPDTFFPNEKKSFFHEATSHNSFLRIDNLGNVVRSIRLTVIANCPMNLHTFPLDVQVCALEIESYGYSTADIIYHWHQNNSVTIDENVHLAHFTIGEHFHIERTISLSTGNYSRLTTYFTFKRNIGFYLIQIYFPASLIVVISFVSFWLDRAAIQARVGLGVTTVLTMTTLMSSVNGSLPKVSYVKGLDVFLGVCFFIVFASLLEYATVGYIGKRSRRTPANKTSTTVCYYELDETPMRINSVKHTARRSIRRIPIELQSNGTEQSVPLINLSPNRVNIAAPAEPFVSRRKSMIPRPSKIDLYSRFVFPMIFLTFNAVYWSVYLNA
uniref:Gamma-aminobutyric acid receptor subunit beta n=1 Tax=Panagrolaimus sp. JU765 TaxID=591449 RepID=A0AC34R330_9BILA